MDRETGNDPARLSAAALFDRILREQADVFARRHAALQQDDAPENPHRARVALRRLRSALDGFAPILDAKQARKLSRRARGLFRILGPLRDADVAVLSFGTGDDREAFVARAGAVRDGTREALVSARAADFAAEVEAALDSGRLMGGDAAARRMAAADAGLLAALALQRAWTEALVYGPALHSLEDEPRHEFRKDMKSLRYLTEFFAGSIEGAKPRRFLRRMEALQDDLGELNDIFVHAGDAPLGTELQRRVDRAMEAAEGHWARLRKLGPWWV
ncbi:CHAD domain-containing protein [Paracoccus sp. S-4012]|uniref:CHAD domain-containing protein n=1 Tax=Paracoccus sp. S-4012 TaxID=2665648 RepID=UPI0012AFBEBC|nr:CHAD domain-containing protein [Paracoccus sp. S-4012]MRX50373.1 CHAD domain-containing protein [Paracoccus sp. S-4012]